MYRGESTTANLEGLKEGLPHGRREGCNKVLLFILFCFRDYYALSCFLCLLLGHACPCKNMLFLSFRSLCTNHPSLFHLQHLIYLVWPTCELVLAGREGARGEMKMGQTKDMRRNSSARNENNDKYNMMLLWSDQDH